MLQFKAEIYLYKQKSYKWFFKYLRCADIIDILKSFFCVLKTNFLIKTFKFCFPVAIMGLILIKYSVTVIVLPLTNLVAIDPYNLALFPKF